MGNHSNKNNNSNDNINFDNPHNNYNLLTDTINLELPDYNLKLSKILNEDKIYIKIIEKSYNNKYIHIYYYNSFDTNILFNINSYFKSLNTKDNAYKNILYLIKNKNFEINKQNSELILSLNKSNKDNKDNNCLLVNLNFKKFYQTLDEIKFNKNPNLEFKNTLAEENSIYGCDGFFEAYYCYKDNNQYIASANNNNNIDIIRLISQEKKVFNLIYQLKSHKKRITFVKYFLNKNTFDEYLVSSDESKVVIIWDITNNYIIKYKINTNYKEYILSCLILFNINNQNIIITSTLDNTSDKKGFSKIYSLDKNCKFIKNIKETNRNSTLNLIYWFNRYNSENYLIECCDGNIGIYNIATNTKYCEFQSGDDDEVYFYGIIYKKNNEDFLITTSGGDYIRIWDLYKKIINYNINTKGCGISCIIRWSERYFICADQENNSFKIIDIAQLKVINNIKIGKKIWDERILMKKIYHPQYGESLLTGDGNNSIKLWNLKNYSFIKINN